MGRAPIPDHFASVTIEQIPKRALRESLLRYGKEFWQAASRGIAPMFLGPPSVYKSYGAAALAKALHERACVRVDWCNVPVTLNQLERKRFERATDERIEAWKQVPFLVIDDFGMIKMGTWQYNALAEIAMYRFDTSRPTCWTGNIEIDGSPSLDAITNSLQACVGTQLTRRMMERSEGYRLYVP
jgi:DNA replication protein DnaC